MEKKEQLIELLLDIKKEAELYLGDTSSWGYWHSEWTKVFKLIEGDSNNGN